MDDSDIIILDDCKNTNTITGIPSTFEKDSLNRFSFGAPRRSLSQPALLHLRPSFDDEESPVVSTQAAALISPLKKKRAVKVRSIQKEFFGVYCLISRSSHKSYKNRTYIGYTVDPNRRINQHNGGKDKGGAKKTDSRGPWDMVCIVHGFPNNVAALRFEWAWQNPDKSKMIRDLQLKKQRKESPFAFRLRIACHLMNCNPWKRFALTFRWLIPAEELTFPNEIPPPKHVDRAYGLVTKSTVAISEDEQDYTSLGRCQLCRENIEQINHLGRCLRHTCRKHYHLSCLATHGQGKLKECQLFPIRSACPQCFTAFLWGEIIQDQRSLLKVAESNEENIKLRGLVLKRIE